MRQRIVTVFAFLISLLVAGAGHAQNFGDPYYLTDKTFALDPSLPPGSSTYRIATFLPHHTLVFVDPKKLTVTIGGDPQTTVITEYGQRLLVPQRLVSGRTFKDVYRDLTIVFHEDSFYCPEDNRDCGTATGLDISKGSVFALLGNSDGFVKLQSKVDGDTQVGFLTTQRFEQLRSEAVLTDTSLPHPRLLVTRTTRLDSLGTGCGEVKKSISERSLRADAEASAEPGDGIKFLTRLSGILNLNVKLTTQAEFKRTGSTEASYGENGVSLQFWRMDLQALDGNARLDPNVAKRTLIIEAKQLCLASGPTAFPAAIKEVSVREDAQGGVTALLGFRDFYPTVIADYDKFNQNDQAFRVFQLNGNQPFLTSITSTASYTRVRHVWDRQVFDGSIAEILMGMFNATCPRKPIAGKMAIQTCDEVLETPNPG